MSDSASAVLMSLWEWFVQPANFGQSGVLLTIFSNKIRTFGVIAVRIGARRCHAMRVAWVEPNVFGNREVAETFAVRVVSKRSCPFEGSVFILMITGQAHACMQVPGRIGQVLRVGLAASVRMQRRDREFQPAAAA